MGSNPAHVSLDHGILLAPQGQGSPDPIHCVVFSRPIAIILSSLCRCERACAALVTCWLGTNLRGEVKPHLSPPKELGCTLSRLMSKHNHSFNSPRGRQSGSEGSSDALLLDRYGPWYFSLAPREGGGLHPSPLWGLGYLFVGPLRGPEPRSDL